MRYYFAINEYISVDKKMNIWKGHHYLLQIDKYQIKKTKQRIYLIWKTFTLLYLNEWYLYRRGIKSLIL